LDYFSVDDGSYSGYDSEYWEEKEKNEKKKLVNGIVEPNDEAKSVVNEPAN